MLGGVEMLSGNNSMEILRKCVYKYCMLCNCKNFLLSSKENACVRLILFNFCCFLMNRKTLFKKIETQSSRLHTT